MLHLISFNSSHVLSIPCKGKCRLEPACVAIRRGPSGNEGSVPEFHATTRTGDALAQRLRAQHTFLRSYRHPQEPFSLVEENSTISTDHTEQGWHSLCLPLQQLPNGLLTARDDGVVERSPWVCSMPSQFATRFSAQLVHC